MVPQEKLCTQICLTLLLSVLIGCGSLHSTIKNGNLAEVSASLSARDVRLDEFDGECKSPLMVAVETDQPEMVKLLLERGADPNLRAPSCFIHDHSLPLLSGYHSGQTALFYSKSVRVAKLLLKANANVNLGKTIIRGEYYRSASYKTPLENAIVEGNVPLVEFLIENKANVNQFGAGLSNSYFTSNEIYNDSDPTVFLGIKKALEKAGGKRKKEMSEAELAKTKSKIYRKYKHLPTGEVFEWKSEVPEGTPMILTWKKKPVVLPMGESIPIQEYHLIEFVWVDSGENVFEWYAREANREKMIGQ